MNGPIVPKTLTTKTATPNIPENKVVLTSGSSVQIKGDADKTFQTILDTDQYGDWNSWCPALEFPGGQSIRQVDAVGTMKCYMQVQGRLYHIPIKVVSVSDPEEAADSYTLVWRSRLLPSWFAMAERVQTVTKLSPTECELRQWESMSGWGAYLLKWFLRIQGQLDEANTRYAAELKARAEKL